MSNRRYRYFVDPASWFKDSEESIQQTISKEESLMVDPKEYFGADIPSVRVAYEALGPERKVLAEISVERKRQDEKWGQQNHPFTRLARYDVTLGSKQARYRCDKRFAEGRGSFADILLEEVYEAIDADSEADARAELVQVAAVAVAAIQAIDRRQGGAK